MKQDMQNFIDVTQALFFAPFVVILVLAVIVMAWYGRNIK